MRSSNARRDTPRQAAPRRATPRLTPVVVGLALLCASTAGALTVGADFRIGNLQLERDRKAGQTTFAGDQYPIGGALYATETLADQLRLDAGFYFDPILRNVSYSLFSYQQSLFTLTVGPFFGFFNAPGSILKSGISSGVRVELPGIAFVSFRADSTIGGRLVEVGDYLQERSELTAGFWVPNAIGTVSLRSKSYTEKRANSEVVDSLTEYEFATQVFQKNVPYRVEIALGYHDLSKSFVAASTTYTPGLSQGTDSAVTTLMTGQGVCRDYAHVVIALLRAMDMPARYAACFAPGLEPMDFHAVAEAYHDGLWYVIDATRLADRRSLVRIATGRDAADCAFLSFHGGNVGLSRLHVDAWNLDPVPALGAPDDFLTPVHLG